MSQLWTRSEQNNNMSGPLSHLGEEKIEAATTSFGEDILPVIR